jgi:hypothetical protein
MNISTAVELLLQLQKKFGDVEIYFDCPKCGLSYSPGIAVTQTVHLTEDITKKKA